LLTVVAVLLWNCRHSFSQFSFWNGKYQYAVVVCCNATDDISRSHKENAIVERRSTAVSSSISDMCQPVYVHLLIMDFYFYIG